MKTNTLVSIFFALLLCLINISCEGNDCAALTTGLTDGDSDCIADTSDNCIGTPNGDQTDLDEDGVGAACDSDDADDTVALISRHLTQLRDDGEQILPDFSGTFFLQTGTCQTPDQTLQVTQSGLDVQFAGDHSGSYLGTIQIAEDDSLFLSADLDDATTCQSFLYSTQTLSFYCYARADVHSNGCVNVYEKLSD